MENRAEKGGRSYVKTPEQTDKGPGLKEQFAALIAANEHPDFDLIAKTVNAQAMSLKKSELEVYKKITDGKMNKQEIEKYLQEDDLREQEKA